MMRILNLNDEFGLREQYWRNFMWNELLARIIKKKTSAAFIENFKHNLTVMVVYVRLGLHQHIWSWNGEGRWSVERASQHSKFDK